MDPWTKPIFDIFLEYYKQHEIDYMIKESIIEISPLSFMRGRTFKNSIIIADEMQNSTPNQMLMLTTRIGVGSKMIITGDLLQTDRLVNNGLSDIINRIDNYQNKTSSSLLNIKVIKMSESDIQRSEVVKDILTIYK
jgi:phosphate starvation-inducible PhoH-like protein